MRTKNHSNYNKMPLMSKVLDRSNAGMPLGVGILNVQLVGFQYVYHYVIVAKLFL